MSALRLGIRLALAPAARVRSGLLTFGALIVTVVLITTAATARFELLHASAYQIEMPRIILAVVTAIAMPCLVLLSTVARLAAAVRDRRLGNLRLIGLSPTQTRLVAVGETGIATGVGALLGVLTFWLIRPLMVAHPIAGRAWDASFGPSVVDQVLVVSSVGMVVVAVALLPTRTTSRDPLAVARRADRTLPGWWRLVPLAVGTALCATVLIQGHQRHSAETDRQVALMLPGVALLGLGLVLVLPVLVRLITRALTHRPLGASWRIAVRRMESQPAAVSRIIGTLLVGLFLVTGARYVLVAFESTPQYQSAAHSVEHEQRVAVFTQERKAAAMAERIRATDGVREVIDLPQLHFGRHGLQAVVATCSDLAGVGADVSDCREGVPMWLEDYLPDYVPENFPQLKGKTDMDWTSRPGGRDRPATGSVTTPIEMAVMDPGPHWATSPLYAAAVIPPQMARDLPPSTRHVLVVTSPPGRDLDLLLTDAGINVDVPTDYADYDFVATIRGIVWAIAAVIVGIGLLALGIATIDRVAQRRKEVVGLQLVGVSPRVIRQAQLIETAFPLTIGIVLAVGLGALGGGAYLTLDETIGVPWAQTWNLAGAAVLGAALVGIVCTAASAPRLRPEELRTE